MKGLKNKFKNELTYELIAAFLLITIIVFTAKMTFYPKNGNASYNNKGSDIMSPCQCKIMDICKNTYTYFVPKTKIYNDGTYAGDYDKWGKYVGNNKEVPQKCKES